MGTVVWEPVEDTEQIAWGLRTMIEANGMDEFVDCKVCRAITVPDAAPVPSAEVRGAIRGLVDYFMQMHAAAREEAGVPMDSQAVSDAEGVLAWLNGIGGDNAA